MSSEVLNKYIVIKGLNTVDSDWVTQAKAYRLAEDGVKKDGIRRTVMMAVSECTLPPKPTIVWTDV